MSQDFADILRQWEKDHDDTAAIEKRARRTANDSCGPFSQGPTLADLRRMKAQAELDLHEYKLEDAVRSATIFIEDSHRKGLRKVRIITGKGLHSKGGEAVLRPRILELCQKNRYVREVSSSKAEDGGSGALSLILR